MRVVFFGTPEFAEPSLRALVEADHDVVGVVTQPDKPKGRSRSVFVPPPIKTVAEEYRLPVLQPDQPTGDLFRASLKRMNAELGVVVAYGHILRQEILDVPTMGMINIHASLLPRWRGAAPIQKAILEGDPVTGVSIMQMDAGMDTGAIIHHMQTFIQDGDTTGDLLPRLAELGATAMVTAIEGLVEGTATFTPQDEEKATHAPKVTRAMARIDWHDPADRVAHQTRAFDPTPGSWALLDEAPIKLFHGEAIPTTAEPGTVLDVGETLLVACGSGAVRIGEVQPAGKRRLPVADWARGRSDLPGQLFE
ncbi:MAG: methionyl-tRNA formyltransferase [Gemmatimonadales bacterium]